MEECTVRAYGRTELALRYFPGNTPQAAYRKLQYCIDLYPGLRQQLEEKGYSPHLRTFLPAQVQLIFDAIGAP